MRSIRLFDDEDEPRHCLFLLGRLVVGMIEVVEWHIGFKKTPYLTCWVGPINDRKNRRQMIWAAALGPLRFLWLANL